MKVVTCVLVACLVLSAGPASAEWFVDVYAGQTFTQENDVTVHSSAGLSIYRDVEFDQALIYGVRFGHYFASLPFLGLGVDVFNFSPRIGPQPVRIDGCVPSGTCSGGQGGTNTIDVDVFGISLDLILRLPLWKTERAPWGAIQPFVTAGVPLFITTVTPRTTVQFRNHDEDTSFEFGYKVGAGIAFHVARNLMLFAEGRFTHAPASVELRDAATLTRAPLRMDLDTYSAIMGLSARW